MQLSRTIVALGVCLGLLGLGTDAAIITERNDVYNEVGCYAPERYTFIGTSALPGIASSYIPYGTYTGGNGGTEYLRVSDKLMGVVASAIGGLAERECALWQWSITRTYMMRPLGIDDYYQSWDDHGEFLDSSTNLSLRIADQMNLPMMSLSITDRTNYHYEVWSGDNQLEHRLLNTAVAFGSRQLESLITGDGHSIEPPISSQWSSTLPYNASDTNRWLHVYPVLGNCTNDIHFLSESGAQDRIIPDPFSMSSSIEVWGDDLYDALGELRDALYYKPFAYTVEDVLSADTGWKYEVPPVETSSYWTVSGSLGRFHCELVNDHGPNDRYYRSSGTNYYAEVYLSSGSESAWIDVAILQVGVGQVFYGWDYYTGDDTYVVFDSQTGTETYTANCTRLWNDADDFKHWRNMTTRLDWKRLGIICQIERQMDTTYENSSYTDELPLWNMSTRHSLVYRSEPVEIAFPVPTRNGQTMPPVSNLFQSVSWDLDKDREEYVATTNNSQWSTPTCRTPIPAVGEGVFMAPNHALDSTPIYLTIEKAEDLVRFVRDEYGLLYTQKMNSVQFIGDWGGSDESMAINFTCRGIVGKYSEILPSNTVAVTVSDGFAESSWSNASKELGNWSFFDGYKRSEVYFTEISNTPVRCELSYYDINYNTNIYYSTEGETIPKVVISPRIDFYYHGSGPVTNWTWEATDYGTLSGPSIQDGRATWATDDRKCVVRVSLDDTGYEVSWVSELGSSVCSASLRGNGNAPTHIVIPVVSLAWDKNEYTVEKSYGDYGDIIPDFRLPVVWTGPTNIICEAISSIGKEAQASFTYASPSAREETIARFPWANSVFDWDRIRSMRRSELEMMLYDRGNDACASDTLPSDYTDFTWLRIKSHSHSGREFRMREGTPMLTLSNADLARYNMLADLSGACKDKCAEMGGMNIGSIENVGKVTPSERSTFLSDLRTAVLGATFTIGGETDFTLGAKFDDDGNVIEWYYNPQFPILIGGCGWGCSIDCDWSSLTNSYRAARADAYQAPVRKTVWKFKNLRDPNP